MQAAPIPQNEAQRLGALRGLGILDTPAEERFDRITRIAQHVLEVPIVLVSLVDEDRQWFKSKQGLSASETPRDISICGYTILGDGLFLVPDASLDPRFSDNPLVTGDPRLRFYAGQPLSGPDGSKLGTLCAIDRRPRQFGEAEKGILRDLAAIVENELHAVELNTALASLRESQAALVRAKEAAESATRAKSEFLANMSHEIRTPMNAVIGMADLLRDTRLNPRQRDFAETIRGSGEHLLAILNDILDFSKIEAGKMTLETADFDLREVMEGAAKLLAGRAKERGLRLSTSIADDVPASLRGAGGRLRQVLLNLASNAVKFTPKGRVVLSAVKEAETETHATIRLTVRDTGVGIPEETLSRLFQPFSQADASTTRRFGGTGLGLAISKKLIELMGGEIGAESRPGKGSAFWCRAIFEKQGGRAASAPPAGRRPPPSRRRAPRRHFRLLVVEDNVVNQKVARLQLEKLGYTADIVGSGPQALKALARSRYDLILMDCQMPGMDGYTTTSRIREQEGPGRHVPIIAMTANAMEGDREKCLESGMDDYVAKPVERDALAAMLDKWDAPVDPSVLSGLRELSRQDGGSLAREVIGLYLGDAPRRLKALRRAASKRDAPGMAQAAHALKSASGNVGAKGMQALCGRIEALARSGKAPEAARLLTALLAEFQRARAVLEAERKGG